MKKVLLVDDDIALVNLYEKSLKDAGFDVYKAHNGIEGHKVALREHPDLILLDIKMPGMDGMTMMKKVRSDFLGKNVPIIMLTNLDTDDKILQGIVEDQPAYYLLKDNVDPEGVVEKVKEVLGYNSSS